MSFFHNPIPPLFLVPLIAEILLSEILFFGSSQLISRLNRAGVFPSGRPPPLLKVFPLYSEIFLFPPVPSPSHGLDLPPFAWALRGPQCREVLFLFPLFFEPRGPFSSSSSDLRPCVQYERATFFFFLQPLDPSLVVAQGASSFVIVHLPPRRLS